MNNLEKYFEKYPDHIFCKGIDEYQCTFLRCNILPINNTDCYNTSCEQCKELFYIWAHEECREEIDWTTMKVDTRILVRDSVLERWKIGYFAKYEDGKVYTFSKGQTSHTSNGEMWSWDYAELSDLLEETK